MCGGSGGTDFITRSGYKVRGLRREDRGTVCLWGGRGGGEDKGGGK